MVNKLTLKTIFDGKSGADTATPKPEDGNAFSSEHGTKISDQILAGAALLDDDVTTSISALSDRLSAFNTAAHNKKKQGGNDADSMYMSAIMAQKIANDLIGNLNNKIAEAEDKRDKIIEAQQRFADGDFDPLNNDKDFAFIRELDPSITRDDWANLSEQQKQQFFDTHLDRIDERIQSLTDARRDLAEGKIPEIGENGKFANPVIEEIYQELSQNPDYKGLQRHQLDDNIIKEMEIIFENKQVSEKYNKTQTESLAEEPPTQKDESYNAIFGI